MRICTITTSLLWHLFMGLFVKNTHCLPDNWNIDTQHGEILAASESSLLGIGIAGESPSIALGTTTNGIYNNGAIAIALSPEITTAAAEGISSSDCGPDPKRLPSKQKARRGNDICPADRLQFKNGETGGRQILPIAPSAQQGAGRENSGNGGGGGNGNGSGQPRAPIPRFTGPEDPLRDIFIPEKIRPRKNEDVCPHIDYHVPVCAREVDAYISTFPVPGDTILDPCHLCKMFFFSFKMTFFFFTFIRPAFEILMQKMLILFCGEDEPLMGCLFMEGEIGFCCLMAAVAYVSAIFFFYFFALPTPTKSHRPGQEEKK